MLAKHTHFLMKLRSLTMHTNDLKDPKLEQIIKEIQEMRKDFEELEVLLAKRELENKNEPTN
jgi:hypothetical protein